MYKEIVEKKEKQKNSKYIYVYQSKLTDPFDNYCCQKNILMCFHVNKTH